MRHTIRHIAILIPARDEEHLLPRCIRSVLKAKERLPAGITYDLIVVVDSSTDRTFDIARNMITDRGTVLSTDAGTVGVTRSIAANAALTRYAGPYASCWLANTDADCEVPESWLIDQLLLAQTGAQAVAGIVDVDDFSEHRKGVKQRFREAYLIGADGTHPHVHGANIGVRADVYLKAGGWASLPTAEDHDLWNRLSSFGCVKLSVVHLKVLTSGRRFGRAPHGFADTLAAHGEAIV